MIYTYSRLEAAKKAIPEFCRVREQDVFIVHVKCPSTEEWCLRTRDEIFSEDSPGIVHKYYLPFAHRFNNLDNAQREADVWSRRLNLPITLERHIKIEKGYKVFSHYTLKE